MNLKEQCLQQNATAKHGKNYSAINPGKFADLMQYKLQHPLIPNRPVPGKLFLKDLLGLNSMQISMGSIVVGRSIPFTHSHKLNEEVYIFVRGQGQMLVDQDVIDVEEGSVIRVAPAGQRSLRNTGTDELHYIVIQAKENSLSQDTFDDGVPGGAPAWPS